MDESQTIGISRTIQTIGSQMALVDWIANLVRAGGPSSTPSSTRVGIAATTTGTKSSNFERRGASKVAEKLAAVPLEFAFLIAHKTGKR